MSFKDLNSSGKESSWAVMIATILAWLNFSTQGKCGRVTKFGRLLR